jgi:transcriptional regulator with XRE-family HTH domain
MDNDFYNRLISLMIPGEKIIDFPKRIGIRPQTFYNWKHGKLPERRLLQRISDTLGVSMSWLLTGEGDKYPGRAGARRGEGPRAAILM